MSIELDLVGAIRRLADPAHTRPDAEAFVVRSGELDIDVRYTGGSSSSLTLSARYDVAARRAPDGTRQAGSYRDPARGALVAVRPMAIHLRAEQAADVDAKAAGINREIQTGDAAFDAAVYVSSPGDDEAVIGAVLGPEVRRGAAALLALGVGRIAIDDDDGRVEARLVGFLSDKPSAERGPAMIAAFAELLRGLPVVQRAAGGHPPDPWRRRLQWGGVLALLGFIALMPVYMVVAGTVGCTEGGSEDGEINLKPGCSTPLLLAVVAAVILGALGAALATAFVSPHLRGRSSSAMRIAGLQIVAFSLFAELGFYVVSALGLVFGIGRG